MTDFTFRPALLRAAKTHSVTADRLSVSGEVYAHKDLTKMRYYMAGTKAGVVYQLTLGFGERQVKVEHVGPRYTYGLPESDLPEETQAFRRCVRALIAAAQTHRPDLQVEVGAGRVARWIYFVLGLSMIVAGISFVIAGIVSGFGVDEMILPGVFGVGFVIVGAAMAYFQSPFRQLPTQSLTQFAERFKLKSG